MAEDWSVQEVKIIVRDYFSMLVQEQRGEPYSKAEHWRALIPQLNGRSKQSIEFKLANISAVLSKYGYPYIFGYKPRGNFQKLLETEVLGYLNQHVPTLAPLFEAYADAPVREQADDTSPDFAHCEELAPEPSPAREEEERQFRTIKIDYSEREQRNRTVGSTGEQFVIAYEQWRLAEAGRDDLIPLIKWVSKEEGDGAGYDILSRNVDGTPRYIEVKSTKLGKEAPIYVSATEIAFASRHTENFYLYRVFDLAGKKRLFIKQGSFEQYCRLTPVTFRGIF